ncbi:MAG: SRPBCC domain-containing protein [Fibrobacteres bacterium]|nr:SRPBCC domain-containing protein [Fibrobacterota bacterium]
MITKEQSVENLTTSFTEEIRVRASLDATFAAILEEIGPHQELETGKPLPMILEAWPGGRWYRDLGNNDGHCWGHVQAIKRSTLLEISGPLMMSYPTVSNIQYRLSQVDGETLIKFHHIALGLLKEEHKAGFPLIWKFTHSRLKARAEK